MYERKIGLIRESQKLGFRTAGRNPNPKNLMSRKLKESWFIGFCMYMRSCFDVLFKSEVIDWYCFTRNDDFCYWDWTTDIEWDVEIILWMITDGWMPVIQRCLFDPKWIQKLLCWSKVDPKKIMKWNHYLCVCIDGGVMNHISVDMMDLLRSVVGGMEAAWGLPLT